MSVSPESAIKCLKYSVQVLASNAQTQLSLYPDFTDKAFEIIDDFDNWYNATKWRDDIGLTTARSYALEKLYKSIECMNTDRIEEEHVASGKDWEELRILAKACLSVWGWESGHFKTAPSKFFSL